MASCCRSRRRVWAAVRLSRIFRCSPRKNAVWARAKVLKHPIRLNPKPRTRNFHQCYHQNSYTLMGNLVKKETTRVGDGEQQSITHETPHTGLRKVLKQPFEEARIKLHRPTASLYSLCMSQPVDRSLAASGCHRGCGLASSTVADQRRTVTLGALGVRSKKVLSVGLGVCSEHRASDLPFGAERHQITA